MMPVFHAEDRRGKITLFHHGYLTTGEVGPGVGFQLDYPTAVGLIAAIQDWMEFDNITDDGWDAGREITARPLRASPTDSDPLADATKNCPTCLRPMVPGPTGWICDHGAPSTDADS